MTDTRERYGNFIRPGLDRGMEVYLGLQRSGLIQATEEEIRALLVSTWVLAASWTGFVHSLLPAGQRPAPLVVSNSEDIGLRRHQIRSAYQETCLNFSYL